MFSTSALTSLVSNKIKLHTVQYVDLVRMFLFCFCLNIMIFTQQSKMCFWTTFVVKLNVKMLKKYIISINILKCSPSLLQSLLSPKTICFFFSYFTPFTYIQLSNPNWTNIFYSLSCKISCFFPPELFFDLTTYHLYISYIFLNECRIPSQNMLFTWLISMWYKNLHIFRHFNLYAIS